ncbi:D-amino-acid transaminase [Mesobacillus zeae]|uniref:D-alanine aminotransferase n=1 Tax=Mesobacillus zeae TaxID=1917180 RepID=A0A398AZV9_9BACI|nr:D-amino-acid transaminase [Mesobacillus zeae]RID83082.1 D-amino-acid transaminase [Mesobacillus zeae]
MEFVMLNGEVMSRETAKVDIEDRGYQFGDGVYEVIRVYNRKLFTAAEHLRRLEESAKKVGINVPYSIDEIQSMLEELIERNKIVLGIVYLQFTRGISPRKHTFPGEEVAPTFVAYTRHVGRPAEKLEKGMKAITEEDIRWLRCDIKSLNLLGNLLASQKAAESGCDEAILHRGETVTEGSHTNVSIVVDGKVVTHAADNFILNGISRQKMLEICRRNDVPVIERNFTVDELLKADEVFLTGTTIEVVPVIEIDGKPAGNGKPGPVTRKLQQWFEDEIKELCGSLQGV